MGQRRIWVLDEVLKPLLIIFPDPCHPTPAPAAFAHEHEHAGVNPGGNTGDPGHPSTAGAPDRVENLELGVAWYGPPDILGLGCKRVPVYKYPGATVFFATNETFAHVTVIKVGPDHFSSAIGCRDHLGAACHLHLPYGVAKGAKFSLHYPSLAID